MLDPQKIPVFKIKTAYGLDAQEVESLLNALFPDNVFPFEIWRQAYTKWNMHRPLEDGPVKPPTYLSGSNTFPTPFYAIQLVGSLIEPARLGNVSALENGFEAVIQATYGDTPFPFQKEKEKLFQCLHEEIKKRQRQDMPPTLWRMTHPLTFEYDFIHVMLPDTIAVNKNAAIQHLHACGYPLRLEVKGITRSLVDAVINSPAPEAAAPPIESADSVILVPASLWEGKTEKTTRDGMMEQGFRLSVIAHVLHHWCGVENKTQLGRWLGPPNLTDRSYLRFADKLLAEAAALNIQPD
jgi:hypothetical protein